VTPGDGLRGQVLRALSGNGFPHMGDLLGGSSMEHAYL